MHPLIVNLSNRDPAAETRLTQAFVKVRVNRRGVRTPIGVANLLNLLLATKVGVKLRRLFTVKD